MFFFYLLSRGLKALDYTQEISKCNFKWPFLSLLRNDSPWQDSWTCVGGSVTERKSMLLSTLLTHFRFPRRSWCVWNQKDPQYFTNIWEIKSRFRNSRWSDRSNVASIWGHSPFSSSVPICKGILNTCLFPPCLQVPRPADGKRFSTGIEITEVSSHLRFTSSRRTKEYVRWRLLKKIDRL